HVATPSAAQVVVHGQGPVADRFAAALPDAVREQESDWIGLNVDGHQLRLTDGRRAAELARDSSEDALDAKLRAAGITPQAGNAQSVLERLKAQRAA
ncbi:hypothetical protein, partial [Klebsiella variicola]|uniref:hypothetical protein n=1 Tax=Klebsiella variicola TaxID=244366 RepID=UPI002730840C